MGKKPKVNILQNKSGFTLIEVMIAIVIFATFSTVFVTGFGYNLLDSGKLKEDIRLKDYAENKLNEITINPPAFDDSLTLTKETKDVEKDTDYQTIVEYKKFTIPDMNKLQSNSDSLDESDEEKSQNQLEQKVFEIFKTNMEAMIWQVEVTVKNKLTGDTYRLSSWLLNQNAEVKIGSF